MAQSETPSLIPTDEMIRAQAATAALNEPLSPCPYPPGSMEWNVWITHFQGVMSAEFEG